MIRSLRPAGINVPPGFAVTADAYWAFLEANQLREPIQSALRRSSRVLSSYTLEHIGPRLLTGLSVGSAVATGKVRKLRSASEGANFEDGMILVTEMTDPDWVPMMKRAAAIVTEHGGRTSHAAIVSREMGLPAVVGTGEAMQGARPF
jgi:pyruvate,water dikinase